MTEEQGENMFITSTHNRFAATLQQLGSLWDECTSSWRDQRAMTFESEILTPIQRGGQSLMKDFETFLALIYDVRDELSHFDLPNLQLEEKEMEYIDIEGKKTWETAEGQEKRRFGINFGQFAHSRYAEEIVHQEDLRGRRRNVHYGIEYETQHPDGGIVRYDYVDLQKHVIVDYKPIKPDQSESDVVNAYKEQRQRHIDAYTEHFGIVPTYRYVFYPSSVDLFSTGTDES